MTFSPENPASPNDLYATFAIDGHLTGLIYTADGNSYSRINGEWEPLGGDNNPFGQGALMVFVDPSFTEEYDARMMYGEFLQKDDVRDKYGVKPNFGQ